MVAARKYATDQRIPRSNVEVITLNSLKFQILLFWFIFGNTLKRN